MRPALILTAILASFVLVACSTNPAEPGPVGPPPGSSWMDVDVHVYPAPAPAPTSTLADPMPDLPAMPADTTSATYSPDLAPAPLALAGPDFLRSGSVGALGPREIGIGLVLIVAAFAVLALVGRARGRFPLVLLLLALPLGLAGCQSDWTLATVGDVEAVEAKLDATVTTMDDHAKAALLDGKTPGEAALAGISDARGYVEANDANGEGGSLMAILGGVGAFLGLLGYRVGTGRFPLVSGIVELAKGVRATPGPAAAAEKAA